MFFLTYFFERLIFILVLKNHLGVQQDFFHVIYLNNKYIGNSTNFFECICMLFDLGKYVSTTQQQQQNYSR